MKTKRFVYEIANFQIDAIQKAGQENRDPVIPSMIRQIDRIVRYAEGGYITPLEAVKSITRIGE